MTGQFSIYGMNASSLYPDCGIGTVLAPIPTPMSADLTTIFPMNNLFQSPNGSDFTNYMSGDTYSTLLMFKMMMNNTMPVGLSNYLSNDCPNFRTNYNANKFNPKTDMKQFKQSYNPEISEKLAKVAYKNASERNTVGWCMRGARTSMEKANLSNGEIRAASACQSEAILRNHKNFKQVDISREDLKNLPAGCVVVWGASQGHQHGHIAITLGDGREASDHVQKLITNRPAKYSVFVPAGVNKAG